MSLLLKPPAGPLWLSESLELPGRVECRFQGREREAAGAGADVTAYLRARIRRLKKSQQEIMWCLK